MKKNWNKIKTPITPPVKDELGKTANKNILSNGTRNIVLWIRQDTPTNLKQIIIGGYAGRGFELVHTNDARIEPKIIVLEFENEVREARDSGSQYKIPYKNFNPYKRAINRRKKIKKQIYE